MFNRGKEGGPLGNGPMDFRNGPKNSRGFESKSVFNPLKGLKAGREAKSRARKANIRSLEVEAAEQRLRDDISASERKSRAIVQLKSAADSEPTEARLLPNFIGLADTVKRVANEDPEAAVEIAEDVLDQTRRHNDRVAKMTLKRKRQKREVGAKRDLLNAQPVESMRIRFGKGVIAGTASYITELAVRKALAAVNGVRRDYLNTIIVDGENITFSNPRGQTYPIPLDAAENLQFSVDAQRWLDVPLGLIRRIPFGPFHKARTYTGIIRVNSPGRDEVLTRIPAWMPEEVIARIADAMEGTRFDTSPIPDFIPEPSLDDLLRKGGRALTEAGSEEATR